MAVKQHGFLDGLELEPVDEWSGTLTADGRPVVMVHDGVAYAPATDALAEHVRSTMESVQARTAAKQAVVEPGIVESIAMTTCPQMRAGKPCGGSLNRKGVCPGCPVGQAGYRYRYQCDTCGFDIVTKTELAE